MLLPILSLQICITIFHYQFKIINAETEELFNRDAFAFTGLLKYESVPVLFPKDICMFTIEDNKFAACLHLNGERKQRFVIFKYAGNQYIQIYENPAPFALSIDCSSLGDKGYVIVAYNFTEDAKKVSNGSPVYEIFQDEVSPVQYFTSSNLSSVQLRTNGEELFLFQTITSNYDQCPIYAWKGFHFNIIDHIPCNYAKKMEPFQIESNTFMAIANYADERGNFEAFSEIYKFDHNLGQYVLIQKIKTSAAIDVKYFYLEDERDQHFLVFVNSIKEYNSSNSETNAVIYKYENGRFIPLQKLKMHAVQQILPVKSGIGKFVMLVSSYNQPTILFEFNGQKFVKSNVQLTEGAMGKGVSMMRVFQDYNETYIVVANENMLVNETNIYQPIYKNQELVHDKKKEFLDWSEQAYKNLSQYNIVDLRERLKSFEQFKKKLGSEGKRLDSNYAQIKEVVTKLLTFPPKKISSNYWHMIALTKRALDKIEQKLDKLEEVISTSAVPLVQKISENDYKTSIVESRSQLKIDEKINTNSMSVGTLTVREKLLTQKVNNQSRTNIKLNDFYSKSIILHGKLITPDENKTQDLVASNVNRNSNDVLTAEDLIVSGAINAINLAVIEEFAIRKRGNQKIDAFMEVNSLRTNEITTEGLVNGVNVSQVIDTNEGSFVINQELEFIKPIQAKKVQVNERLNNIHVSQGKLDILLTKSQEQFITGQKTFENVQIIEPITITGKIIGQAFEKISPITSINDEIILHGDYEITGKVLVKNLLSSEDIFESSGRTSLLKILDKGLKKNTSEIASNFKFLHPIYANNAILSFANGQNLKSLIQTNTETVQMIHGRKVFKDDLTVKGLCEVGTINSIKIEDLERFTLQTVGDQYITGAMHFKNIIVPQVSSQNINLGENKIENILTTSSNQNIFGSVKIGKLYSSFANIKELKTAYNVMDIDLNDLIKDTVQSGDILSLSGENNFLSSIHAQYLTIKKTVNLQPIEKIENFLADLEGDIKFDGNVLFTGKLSVHNLTFASSFNTVPAEEFGKCWLLNELNQQFTAPQTAAIITIDEDLIMSGTINGFTLEGLLNNTYNINEVEFINKAIFENNVVLQAPLTTSGKINDFNFMSQVLLSKSQIPQQVLGSMIVRENVQVEGYIAEPLKINNLDLSLLHSFIEGNQSEITLDHAIFENAPIIEKLNSHDLKELRENIWLANEDAILESPFRFIETHFNDYDVFKGYINGVNIKSLAQNCFSLSKEQVITTPVAFNQIVTFGNVLRTPKMTLHGHLKDIRRKLTIDFNHFVTNTLTKIGEQEVKGQWNIEQVFVHGNVDNVLVNNLRLPDDVVTYGDEINNITATKRIESAIIVDLLCEPQSAVNQVNLPDWLERSVLIHGNYTVQGATTIDESFFYNGITAHGSVNNVTFDSANLLLKSKDQVIEGDVYVVTKYLERLQISPLTFANLYAEYVNDLDMVHFFDSLADMSNISVSGELVFKNHLATRTLDGDNYIYGLNTAEFFERLQSNRNVLNAMGALDDFRRTAKHIEDNYKTRRYYLSHFEERQIIAGFIRKIVPLSLLLDDGPVDIIAVLSGIENLHLTFYRWDVYKQLFILQKQNILWYSEGQTIIDIFGLSYQGSDILVTETLYNNKYMQNLIFCSGKGLQQLLQLSSNFSRKIAVLELNGTTHFILYSKYNPHISTYCFEPVNGTLKLVKKNELHINFAKQIIALENEFLLALLPESVEIWRPDRAEAPCQIISIQNALHLTTASFEGVIYLAVCTKGSVNSLHFGSVEIYRSLNYSQFEHLQSIEVIVPMQAELAILKESADLLLYILTNSPSQSLLVYEYQGVNGFQQKVRESAIPMGKAINAVRLKSNKQHILAVISNSGAVIIQSVLEKI